MPDLVHRIQEIGEETMGVGAFPEADLYKYADDPNSYLNICHGTNNQITFVDGETIRTPPAKTPVYGFSIGGIYGEKRVRDELYAPLEELQDNCALSSEDYPLFYYRDIAVSPAHHGEGIGTRLAEHLSLSVFDSVTCGIAPIWDRGEGHMENILEKYPVEKLHTFSEYHFHDTGNTCPVCPDGEDCTCTFSIYGLVG